MKTQQALLATFLAYGLVQAAPAPAAEYSSACGGFIGTCLMELQRTTRMPGTQMKSECTCRALNDHPECKEEGYICSKTSSLVPKKSAAFFQRTTNEPPIVFTTPEGYTREEWIKARVAGNEEMLKQLIASIHGENPTIPKEIGATIFEDGSSVGEWYRDVVSAWERIGEEDEKKYFLNVKMEEKIGEVEARLEMMSE